MIVIPEQVRSQLLRNGYVPVPCIGKKPLFNEWQKLKPTVHEVERWSRTAPAASNTGILTRTTPTLDIDIFDPEAAAAIEELARERFEEHGYVLTRFGLAPKRCIPFRTDAPFAKITVDFAPSNFAPSDAEGKRKGERLEFLCDGQQFIAHGTHPDTGKAYAWRGDGPAEIRHDDLPYIHPHEAQKLVDDATQVLIEQFGYRLAKAKPSNGADDEASTSAKAAQGFAGEISAYAAAALEAEVDRVAKTLPNTRNDTLNAAAFNLGQLIYSGDLPRDEVERLLFDAAVECKYVADHDERSARATIRSGIESGMRKPRETSEANDNAREERAEPGSAEHAEQASSSGAKQEESKGPMLLDALDVGDDDQPIEPREWLLGNTFCREFVSGLISPGAGAKTSLRLVQALELTSGRSLIGGHVFVRSNVLFVCLEDGIKEARRRVRAGMIQHEVAREEVKGRLFLTTPMRMKIAQYGPKNSVVEGDLERAIRAFIDEKKIDLVIIDPVKKAHTVEENSNDDMDVVITILATLATEKNIAVDILSHERKAGQTVAGDVNRARGAGAMKDGGRLMYTNTWMTEDEAATFGVEEEARRLLFRVDSAKVNLLPPTAATQWFKLVSVNLDNGNETYPSGDEVQTVERWTPPKTFESFSTVDLNKAIDRLRAGMDGGRRYSTAPSAKARAAWRVLQEVCPDQTEARCREVIKTWVKNGVLTLGAYYDEKERKEVEGIVGAKNVGVEI